MEFESCDLQTAVANVKDGKVFMLVPFSEDLTVRQLMDAQGFVVKVETKKNTRTVKNDADPDQPEKKTTVNKGIDKGKVKALADAGWPVTKIADELGVTPATITYHLKKLKEEDGTGKEL